MSVCQKKLQETRQTNNEKTKMSLRVRNIRNIKFQILNHFSHQVTSKTS